MTGKKKGAVTMGLDTFLTEDAEDWAAQTDDDFIEQQPNYGGDYDHQPSSGGYHDRPDRRERRNYDDGPSDGGRSYDRPRRNYDDRPDLPIPDVPPFVAHVGNLPFRATEDEVFELFSEQVAVENVQIITDRNTNRSKGFGFVTFKTRADLEDALGAHNVATIHDRTISVKVSAGPKEGFRSGGAQREPSRADAVDKWERGRNPPRVEKEREPRRFGNEREGRGFDRDRPRRNYDAPRERKPITIQPRTSDAPIGGPAEVKKSNPFGEARPRDENEFQRKKAEERAAREAAQKQKEIERSAAPRSPKKSSNFRGGNKGGSGRDFSSARDNMGSAPKPKPKEQKKQSQKKFKPPTVQKESAPIATHNIFSALQRDD